MSSEPFISYAQNGEDVILWRALANVRDGRYIDVGAAEPDNDSVTKAFVDRGWRGIDVEPMPDYAELLRAARPGNEVWQVAVSDESIDEVVLHRIAETGLSTIDNSIAAGHGAFDQEDLTVPVKTLDAICEDSALLAGELHFLKVDVEGVEASVLRSFTLGRWRPWVVVVESTLPNSAIQSFSDWEPLLTAAGYQFTLFDGLNRFYVSSEHPELREALSYPACVLDGFLTYRESETNAQLQGASADAIRWRNLAISGFAGSAAAGQEAVQKAVQLRRRVERVERQLKVTREKLEAARTANRTLRAKLVRLESHGEVRLRRKAGRILRRARGTS